VADDELTRPRRALRGVDPELDLTRAYAASRARAHDDAAPEDWAPDGRVEIVLHGAGPRGRRTPRRRPALVWGAAAAAVAALVVAVVNLPAPGVTPGGRPVGSAAASADPTSGTTPPTSGLTGPDVVARAAQAVAGEDCAVKIRTTRGGESVMHFGQTAAGTTVGDTTDTETSAPTPLGKRPLDVLGAVALDVVLDLPDLRGRDFQVHDDLLLENEDGGPRVRVRITPPDGLVLGGDVTRLDLVVDATTWDPYSAEFWATSDDGQDLRVTSELSWTPCGEPSPGPTDDR